MPRPKPSEPAPVDERLRDPDEMIRLGAVGEFLRPDATPAPHRAAIAERLDDTNETTRKMAVLVLGSIGPAAVNDLARGLDEKQPLAVRGMAAQALGQLGPNAVSTVEPLCRSLFSKDSNLRFQASFALGKIGSGSVAELRRVLKTPAAPPPTLSAAIDALGWVGKEAKPSVPDIEDVARDAEDPALRLACPTALVKITGKASAGVPLLAKNLVECEDEEVRVESAKRIGELRENGRGAEKELLSATGDPSARVRAKSAVALATTGTPPSKSVPALRPLLVDKQSDVRVHAGMALAHIGPPASPALPELKEMAKDPDPKVSKTSLEAIKAIEGKKRSKLSPMFAIKLTKRIMKLTKGSSKEVAEETDAVSAEERQDGPTEDGSSEDSASAG